MKECRKCHELKPLSAFSNRSVTKDGLDPWCRPCRNAYNKLMREKHKERIKLTKRAYYEAQRDATRDRLYRNLYGISLEEFDRMMERQRGVCAICSEPPRGGRNQSRLHVDHDRVTGNVRALLCGNCNTLLGLARERPEVLLLAAEYLDLHSQRQEVTT